jgi:transposase
MAGGARRARRSRHRDLRAIDAAIGETRTKPATATAAARASLTGLSGAGPVIAAAVLGDVRTVARVPDRDHVAACTGTAPIEVSSGGRRPAGCPGAAAAQRRKASLTQPPASR